MTCIWLLISHQFTVEESCAKANTLQKRMLALHEEVATLRESNTAKQEEIEHLQQQLQDQGKEMAALRRTGEEVTAFNPEIAFATGLLQGSTLCISLHYHATADINK